MKRMRLTTLCLSLFVLFSCKKNDDLSAQQSDFFIKLYGTSLSQTGSDVVQVDDGGYAFVGTSTTVDKGTDMVLVKTDAFGIEEWTKTFGDSLNDIGNSIELTNDGYILGGTYMYNDGTTDMFLVKTDFNGNEQWRQIVGTPSFDERGNNVITTSTDEYVIIGSTTAPVTKADTGDVLQNPPGQWDILAIGLSNNGDSLWSRQYGGELADYGRDIIEKKSGGYFILGSTVSLHNEGVSDMILISISSDGGIVGPAFYGEPTISERANKIVRHDGDLVVIGTAQTTGVARTNPKLLRFSGDDITNLKWERTVDLGMSAVGEAVTSATDGKIAFTGSVSDSEEGDQVYVMFLHENGSNGENSIYGGGGVDVGSSIISTEEGGLLIGGTTGFEGNSMMELIKVNADGKLE